MRSGEGALSGVTWMALASGTPIPRKRPWLRSLRHPHVMAAHGLADLLRRLRKLHAPVHRGQRRAAVLCLQLRLRLRLRLQLRLRLRLRLHVHPRRGERLDLQQLRADRLRALRMRRRALRVKRWQELQLLRVKRWQRAHGLRLLQLLRVGVRKRDRQRRLRVLRMLCLRVLRLRRVVHEVLRLSHKRRERWVNRESRHRRLAGRELQLRRWLQLLLPRDGLAHRHVRWHGVDMLRL
mmetsp:Transcript_15586/g.48505  ORF Transcript_15586/g.48505 Transcript_15586/m.48505 type:complete len:237 (+) Transcript_15586:805-1515(+)